MTSKNTYLQRKKEKFDNMPNIKFYFTMFLYGFVFVFIFSFVDKILGIKINSNALGIEDILNDNLTIMEKKNFLKSLILMAVIKAPILETLMIHTIPLEFYHRVIKPKRPSLEKYEFYIYMIPGIVFGLLHYPGYYSVSKVLNTMASGLLFSYVYYRGRNRKSKLSATLTASIDVIIIHFMTNAFAVSLLALTLIQ